jgi:hypothetical protein
MILLEVVMEALLTAIVLWLSTNFALPASFDHPRLKFVSAAELSAPLRGRAEEKQGSVSAAQTGSDIVSFYSNESKTIYLAEGWSGKTPADLSVLVHEMVHHLQNVGRLKFECPQAREEIAYKAQNQWLGLFGHDLEQDFQLDGFSILVKTKCFY